MSININYVARENTLVAFQRSPAPSRFPGVKFNWLATDHRALLSERLEQANSLELT